MLVESPLVASFWKLFFCILILFVLISASSFLVIRLGIVFSTPGDTPQNLPKVVKHETDGRWTVKRCPQRWMQTQEVAAAPTGPHGSVTMQGEMLVLSGVIPPTFRDWLIPAVCKQAQSYFQSADVGKAGKLQHVKVFLLACYL